MVNNRDKPKNCYVFVDIEKRSLILDEEDHYSYWPSEEDILDVVRKINKEQPNFDFSRYGVGYITFTYTEYEEGNELEFMNIDVMYKFSEVIGREDI